MSAELLARIGRVMWRELHEYSSRYPTAPTEWDKTRAIRWLEGFGQRLPSQGCGCQVKWRMLLQEHPPCLESRVHFWKWTVQMHGLVNEALGKPGRIEEFLNSR
jgi:hypothetical protein